MQNSLRKVALGLAGLLALFASSGHVLGCSTAPKAAGQSCFASFPTDQAPLSTYVGDFRAEADYLSAWDGKQYVPTYLKGVNLGRGVPGAFPTDFAITAGDYRRWFDKMGDMGVNVVRIYSLHPPALYDALAAHNCANPTKTILLLQGVGLPSDPDMTSNQTLDLHNSTVEFEQMIDEAIDSIHGNASISQRKAHAYGDYRTDVSHWTLGWLIGREVLAQEVLATDSLHATETTFQGSALRLAKGNPTSVWVAARMEHAILTEKTKYDVTRPVAFTNWLETDPLHHPTESSTSMEDVATIDTSHVEPFGAPTGIFASFHVYPYYPDFMSEDPGYQAYFSDEYGSDSYRGYLHDLKRYHGNLPVLVAEFGTPTSWGNGHYSSNGMNQGGHTEAMQAAYTARMVRDIHAEKMAGSIFFAWMDEWFKTSWITAELAFPSDDYPKWHDLANPQQSYGLLAFDLGPPQWDAFPKTVGNGRVQSVETFANGEFHWVKLTFRTPLVDGETFTIGYDTYRDDLGETLLPDGFRSSRRSELALTVTAPQVATLHVMKPYDLYGGNEKMPYSKKQSVASDIGAWVDVRRRTSVAHGSDDGVYRFPGLDQPLGQLVARRADMPSGTRDAVVIDGSVVEIRIPWTLLQIADPATFAAIHDDPNSLANTSMTSEGIGLSISIGGEVLETNRQLWPTWRGAPKFTERYKPSADALAASYGALPPVGP